MQEHPSIIEKSLLKGIEMKLLINLAFAPHFMLLFV